MMILMYFVKKYHFDQTTKVEVVFNEEQKKRHKKCVPTKTIVFCTAVFLAFGIMSENMYMDFAPTFYQYCGAGVSASEASRLLLANSHSANCGPRAERLRGHVPQAVADDQLPVGHCLLRPHLPVLLPTRLQPTAGQFANHLLRLLIHLHLSVLIRRPIHGSDRQNRRSSNRFFVLCLHVSAVLHRREHSTQSIDICLRRVRLHVCGHRLLRCRHVCRPQRSQRPNTKVAATRRSLTVMTLIVILGSLCTFVTIIIKYTIIGIHLDNIILIQFHNKY